MIILSRPEERYLVSYTEAYDAYAEIGISTYGMTDPRSCDIFEKYENYRLERNLKPCWGLERVLITCNDQNIASSRVMEKNGCFLENVIDADGLMVGRYWRSL